MKTFLKSTLWFLLFILIMGCSKSQKPEAPEKPAVKDPVVVPPPPPPSNPAAEAKWIPVKIESADQSIQFNYVGTTNMLASMIDSKGLKIMFNYKAELPVAFTSDDSKLVFNNDIWRDANKKINRVSRYQGGTQITPGGEFKIDYNQNEQLIEVRHYSNKNVLLKTTSFTYDASTDLTGIQISTAGIKSQQELSYDQKNGVFKHVPLASLLFLETGLSIFNSLNHNIISKSEVAGTITYSYEYQTDNFPTQMTVIENNQKTTFKITYKTF